MAKITIQPLYLPPQNPEHVRLYNAFSLRALPRSVPFGTGSLSCSLMPAAPVVQPKVVCRLSVNGVKWALALTDTRWLFAHPLFQDPAAAGFTVADLPAELRTAITEALLTPLLTSLASALGAQVLFEEADYDGHAVDAAVGFAVTVTGDTFEPVRMTAALSPISTGAAPVLAGLLATLPRHRAGMLANVTDGIPLTLTFSAGAVSLPADLYGTLETGDVILPDEWYLRSDTVKLTVTADAVPQLEALCTYQNNTATLTNEPAPLPENAMPDTDALEVKLTFELENRTITVGEMKSLQPGYTFTLASDPGAPVTIVANGKPVAKGRLVDVNGSVGVQLTEKL